MKNSNRKLLLTVAVLLAVLALNTTAILITGYVVLHTHDSLNETDPLLKGLGIYAIISTTILSTCSIYIPLYMRFWKKKWLVAIFGVCHLIAFAFLLNPFLLLYITIFYEGLFLG